MRSPTDPQMRIGAKMVILSGIAGMVVGALVAVMGIGFLVKTDLEEME